MFDVRFVLLVSFFFRAKLCRVYQIHEKVMVVFQSAKLYVHFRVMRIS